jgi:hypothetical protein
LPPEHVGLSVPLAPRTDNEKPVRQKLWRMNDYAAKDGYLIAVRPTLNCRNIGW